MFRCACVLAWSCLLACLLAWSNKYSLTILNQILYLIELSPKNSYIIWITLTLCYSTNRKSIIELLNPHIKVMELFLIFYLVLEENDKKNTEAVIDPIDVSQIVCCQLDLETNTKNSVYGKI